MAYYQEGTLEYCVRTAMRLEDPTLSPKYKNLVMLDLMCNLPTDDRSIDVEKEKREVQRKLSWGNLPPEEMKYMKAKKYVLDLMTK